MIKRILIISLLFFGILNAANISTNKNQYAPNDSIVVNYSQMAGNEQNWIAIYPAGSSNAWGNVIQWDWAGVGSGEHTFNPLPVGNYEVRAFYNNSYNLEASKAFSVKNANGNAVTLTLSKDTYKTDEKPKVTFSNMSGDDQDWIAIYPAGSSNAWGNVIQWDWAGAVNGTHTFNKLPAGNYEVRAFFNNSYNLEASKSFTVENVVVEGSTLYENAENGLNPNWIHISGNYAPIHYNGGGFQSNGALVMVPEWRKVNGYWVNDAEYLLPLNADASRKILELDVGGLGNYTLPNGSRKGYIPHYNISIRMHTTDGSRRVIWDSSYNHNGITQPFTSAGGYLIHSPSPVEHVRGWYEPDVFKWEHFKVNIESLLQQMEPNNSITSIDSISFTGGFIDNIELSPN